VKIAQIAPLMESASKSAAISSRAIQLRLEQRPQRCGRSRSERRRRLAAHPSRGRRPTPARRALRACSHIKRSIRCSPPDTPSEARSRHIRLASDRSPGSSRVPWRRALHSHAAALAAGPCHPSIEASRGEHVSGYTFSALKVKPNCVFLRQGTEQCRLPFRNWILSQQAAALEIA